MSTSKSPSSSGKTVLDDPLTVDDVDWLTKHLLAELSQDQKQENQKQVKEKSRVTGVKAGVFRHTSSPDQPLAYYYINSNKI